MTASKKDPKTLVKKPAKKQTKALTPEEQQAAKEAKAKVVAAEDKGAIALAKELPGGVASGFLKAHKLMQVELEKRAAINASIRGIRAQFKEMHVNLSAYDHMRKLANMEPEDMRSFEASVALYKQATGMTLSVYQEALVKQVEAEKEAVHDSIRALAGNNSGKEVGSNSYDQGEGESVDDSPAPAVVATGAGSLSAGVH